MGTCGLLMVTTFVGLLVTVLVPADASAQQHSIQSNGTYGKPCEKPSDCDLAFDQFCDVLVGVCLCIPHSAYDKFGEACRSTSCDSQYEYSRQKYISTGCPDGFHCYQSKCTRFCVNNDYNCHIKPEIRDREDQTYLVLIWVVGGFIAAFYAIILLTCLYRGCKRLRCKRVVTQHGKTILFASSKVPLDGNEVPTKVFSLCYCAPPVTTSTSYMQTHHDSQPQPPAPIVAQPLMTATVNAMD